MSYKTNVIHNMLTFMSDLHSFVYDRFCHDRADKSDKVFALHTCNMICEESVAFLCFHGPIGCSLYWEISTTESLRNF